MNASGVSELATRLQHPSTFHGTEAARGQTRTRIPKIPRDRKDVELDVGGRTVKLTNLQKLFWPELGITKGDLLQYYADVSPVLLPHLLNRAMVMKRYPNGAAGEFFFMKHAPVPRPPWVQICSIKHASTNIVDFPVVQDLAAVGRQSRLHRSQPVVCNVR